jgi:hypothetical protein
MLRFCLPAWARGSAIAPHGEKGRWVVVDEPSSDLEGRVEDVVMVHIA